MPFSKDGDICPTCLPRWESKKTIPKRMIGMPVGTSNKDIEIAICPYCDGDQIIELARVNFNKSAKENEKDGSNS